MSTASLQPKKRRFRGCLVWVSILFLCGACYWLLLAPIPAQILSQTTETSLAAPIDKVKIDGTVDSAQQISLQKLSEETNGEIEALAQNGQIQLLNLDVNIADDLAVSGQEKALYFLSQNPDLYALGDVHQSLRYIGKTNDRLGNTYIQFVQQHKGVPVHASSIIVLINQNSSISNVTANFAPNMDLPVNPGIRSLQAQETALKDFNAVDGNLVAPATLEIYAPEIWLEDYSNVDLSSLRHLAWFVRVNSKSSKETRLYIIDAISGAILENQTQSREVAGQINIIIFQHTNNEAAGIAVIQDQDGQYKEVNPDSDSVAAYKNLKAAYQYYYDHFKRDGYDIENGLIAAHVTLNCSYTAMWKPNDKFFDICNDWGKYPDVLLHEYTHAVADNQVGFPRDQEGNVIIRGLAVHEALADIFAALASQEENSKLVWQINGPFPNYSVIRDLKNPQPGYPTKYSERYADRGLDIPLKLDDLGLEICPTSIGSYDEGYPDCGHINSIILSHTAYLMSEGGDQGGNIPREKLQYLFYSTLENPLLRSNGSLKSAAWVIYLTCMQIKGKPFDDPYTKQNYIFTDEDCRQVQQAFYTVELMTPPSQEAVTNSVQGTPGPNQSATPIASSLPVTLDAENILDSWRLSLRDYVDNLLGKWSPLALFKPFQDLVDRLQNNYLVQCMSDSYQSCVNQFIAELIVGIFNLLLAILTAALIYVLGFLNKLLLSAQQACSTLFIFPFLVVLYGRHRKNRF
jgi:Zn-dependent metalloprotease